AARGLRLVQPDHARRRPQAARRRLRLQAGPREAGRHVPAHAARRVRVAAQAHSGGMTSWVCKACGTQDPPSESPPLECPICTDPRQYVPADAGQAWLTWDDLVDGHEAEVRKDANMLGIGITPSFGIGQRTLLVKSAAGNVLWDCISYLDD